MSDGSSSRPSKSAAKRAAERVRELAQLLIDRYDNEAEALALDETLHAELVLAQRLKKSAAKRQLQRIAQLLRERPDVCAMLESLASEANRRSQHARAQFKLTERRRAALIADDATVRAEIKALATDEQWRQIEDWLRTYRENFDERRQKQAFRSLFQCLHELGTQPHDTVE